MRSWSGKRVLVTGGAGFIGSSLCEKLVALGSHTTILDDFSSSKPSNVAQLLKRHPDTTRLIEADCTKLPEVKKAVRGAGIIFHLAANPEVRSELNRPRDCFKQNVYATHVLLEALHQSRSVEKLVFASTSTVYGDAGIFPTTESYGPLKPISVYGASKLASEAFVSSYSFLYGFKSVLLRLANIIGPRSQHGVIIDFINKLDRNKKELEILGDGFQCKSYLYIDDCVDALLTACQESNQQVEVFNLGSEDWVAVSKIAEIVVEEAGLDKVRFRFSGGVDGGRGWKGDVKKMRLDISRIKKLGWKPRHNSAEAVRKTASQILKDKEV